VKRTNLQARALLGASRTLPGKGRPIAECLALTAADVIAALDGVPPDKRHGPALAIGALRDALNRGE
jgi:hypothetical protein